MLVKTKKSKHSITQQQQKDSRSRTECPVTEFESQLSYQFHGPKQVKALWAALSSVPTSGAGEGDRKGEFSALSTELHKEFALFQE